MRHRTMRRRTMCRRRMCRRRTGLKAAAVAVAVAMIGPPPALAAAAEDQETGGGPEIPHLDLSRVDPAVRAQLIENRRQLDELIAREGHEHDPPSGITLALAHMGRLYLAYDYLQAGVACLETAHLRQPANADFLYLLGYAYDRQGRREEAIDAFERSLAACRGDACDACNACGGGHPVTRLRLGNLLLALHQPQAAAEQFEHAYRADPSCVGALYGRGEVARRSRDDQAAAEYFQQALEKAPDATPVRYSLGLTLRRLGRLEEAEAHLRQADWKRLNFGRWLGCSDPLVARLTELTTGAPAHLLRAAQAAFKGLPEIELAEYRRAVEANPDDAVARANMGTVLYGRGDLTGAAEHYRQAVRLAGDSASYRHDLGQILLELGSTGEAVALFQSAVELNPRFKDAHLKLADIHLRGGRFKEAVVHCRGVIAVDPLHRQARVQLAMALLRLGDRDQAILELGRLMDDHPPEDLGERLRLATLLAQLGDLDRAMQHFIAVSELDAEPTVKAMAHTRVGQVRMQRGEIPAAIESFHAALELAPELKEAKAALDRALGQ